jgi:hypothetical protein
LGGKEEDKPCIIWPQDGKTGHLNLRNAHIGNLAEAEKAWPEEPDPLSKTGPLELDGFTFDHVGGFHRETWREISNNRTLHWWDTWARLDHNYSPGPYTQLAKFLTATGDRDGADEIRFYGRVRERETQKGLRYIWSSALQYVAGFGIGNYTFVVLYWVVGITLFGAVYLKIMVQGVRDENHGFIWCLGASLSRLLPVININETSKISSMTRIAPCLRSGRILFFP